MEPAEEYPVVPADLESYTPAEQAQIVVQTSVRQSQAYAICETDRQALIDWIDNDGQ